ncbi:complement C1q tumor necrosis factor-related protein 1 [Lepisosteus oculatus]|uniref:C1q and TNF related 1 n=1 Tax=Lepisosteus oculatus TaxID=7918 RepID=W5N3B7_LEPOC|nr:PREDICTED: complement C1q tumor necrosis factor-related protein 1 [Lepisosteus oculatus]
MLIHGTPSLAVCLSVLVLSCAGMVHDPYRTHHSQPDLEQSEYKEEPYASEPQLKEYHKGTSSWAEPKGLGCQRCCDPEEEAPQNDPPYRVVPQINITILKGEKGDCGQRGPYGRVGKNGNPGPRGPTGLKGSKGTIGLPGDPCKTYYSAFSVGRKKALHSNEYYQTLVFDTEFVNLYNHFNMFTGKFYCYVPGVYYFSLNVHTWNQKETYMHIMKNEKEMVILYAQPSDRSIMQSQSLMLELEQNDEVWVRLFKGERENAIFSDDFDTYVTFSGHLIKAKSEG